MPGEGGIGSDSTHWRTGTCGMTWSTGCAAVCAMRRAPHAGQNPRRLQLNATRLSWPQSPQRRRRKPWARMPHSRKTSNSSLTTCGSSAPAAPSAGRRRSRRAAAPGGTGWSVPAGGDRREPGRRPVPAGAAAPWLARGAPEVVSPHGLKPLAAPHSRCLPPTEVCLPLRRPNGCLCAGPTGSFGVARSGPRMPLRNRYRVLPNAERRVGKQGTAVAGTAAGVTSVKVRGSIAADTPEQRAECLCRDHRRVKRCVMGRLSTRTPLQAPCCRARGPRRPHRCWPARCVSPPAPATPDPSSRAGSTHVWRSAPVSCRRHRSALWVRPRRTCLHNRPT